MYTHTCPACTAQNEVEVSLFKFAEFTSTSRVPVLHGVIGPDSSQVAERISYIIAQLHRATVCKPSPNYASHNFCGGQFCLTSSSVPTS